MIDLENIVEEYRKNSGLTKEKVQVRLSELFNIAPDITEETLIEVIQLAITNRFQSLRYIYQNIDNFRHRNSKSTAKINDNPNNVEIHQFSEATLKAVREHRLPKASEVYDKMIEEGYTYKEYLDPAIFSKYYTEHYGYDVYEWDFFNSSDEFFNKYHPKECFES